jgi:hypothetical protein
MVMNLRKAHEAFYEARMQYTSQKQSPGTWDMLLGLDAMATDLERRLSAIESNQQAILQQLQLLQSKR